MSIHKLWFYCLFHLVCSAGWAINLARVTSWLLIWVGVERRATASLNVPDDLRDESQIETDWVAQSHYSAHTDQGFMRRENFSRGSDYECFKKLKTGLPFFSFFFFFESVCVGVSLFLYILLPC